MEHFKETEHDTVVLKSKDCSLDGSGKFAKFSVRFEKNPFISYNLRIRQKSLFVIKQCKRNSCNAHQYSHKNDESNETKQILQVGKEKTTPLYFSVLANVMLSPEKWKPSRYCNNYFETCHFIRQIFDRSSENEYCFWKLSDLKSKHSQGVTKQIELFFYKNQSRRDLLCSSFLVLTHLTL